MPKKEKEAWAEETVKQMKSAGLNLDKDTFVFLTGSEYMKPLKPFVKNTEAPMEGKRLGERLGWLNSQINKLKEALNRLKNMIYECLSR